MPYKNISPLLIFSLIFSFICYLGFEAFRIMLYLMVRGVAINPIHVQNFIIIWMAVSVCCFFIFVFFWIRFKARQIPEFLALIKNNLGYLNSALFLLLFFFASIVIVRFENKEAWVRIFYYPLHTAFALWFTGSFALWIYHRVPASKLFMPSELPYRQTRLVKLLPVGVFALGVAVFWGIFDGIPHIIDETAYLFQAWIFSQGRIFLPVPALGDFLRQDFIGQINGKWFTLYPPAWSLLLAPFMRLNLAWIVNPLLGGLAVYLILKLLGRMNLIVFSGIAALLLISSPEILFESGVFMNENIVLVLTLVSILCLYRPPFSSPSLIPACVTGLCVGVVFATRYLDGVCLFAISLLIIITFNKDSLSRKIQVVVLFLCAFTLIFTLNGFYNRSITGDFFRSPFKYYTDHSYGDSYTRMGFGADIGKHLELSWAPGHSLFEAFYNAQLNLGVLQHNLWGWPAGSLIFILLFLVFGKKEKIDYVFLLLLLLYIGGYSLWWYHGVGLGARYYYPLVFIWVVFTIKGVRWLVEEGLPIVCRKPYERTKGWAGVIAFIGMNQILALCFYWSILSGAHFYNFLNVTRSLERDVELNHDKKAVVFIREDRGAPLYVYYFLKNKPVYENSSKNITWQSPILYLRDLGDERNKTLISQFPDHAIYTYRNAHLSQIHY